METDYVGQSESLQIKTYKEIMSGIEFMQSYMEDPDLFTPDSYSLKNFLIQSFCYLHPDFQYLSFVSKEDVDVEIIKISHILQILPSNIKRSGKLFDNMSKDDINKFWLRFFTLFKLKNKFNINSMCNNNFEHNMNFFKDIKSTFNYISYELPKFLCDVNELSNVNITAEIDSWKQLLNAHEEMSLSNTDEEISLLKTDEEGTIDIDTAKLVKDLQHVMSMLGNTNSFTKPPNNPEYVEFFNNIISLTENVLHYKNNLCITYSSILDEINFKMLLSDSDLSGNLSYIKRCNNFIRALKTKIKHLI